MSISVNMDCDKSLDLTVDKAGQLTPGYKS